MDKKVYVVSRRLRIADDWIRCNTLFLQEYLGLTEKPRLISLDDCDLTRLHGLTDCLIILVDLPAVAVRTARLIHPRHTFLDCCLD